MFQKDLQKTNNFPIPTYPIYLFCHVINDGIAGPQDFSLISKQASKAVSESSGSNLCGVSCGGCSELDPDPKMAGLVEWWTWKLMIISDSVDDDDA